VEIPLFGWLKKEEYSKEFLLKTWQEIVARFKVNIRIGEKVEAVEKKEDYFEIHTQKLSYRARFVVLALGRRGTPKKLGVPGEERSKVTYQLLDAQSYTRQHLLVVGGGDSGVEATVGLARQPGNKVSLSYLKRSFFQIKKINAERINELIQEGNVQPYADSEVVEIKEKSVRLQTDNGAIELPNDYVFIFIGGVPPFEMLKKMGIAFGGQAQIDDEARQKPVKVAPKCSTRT